MKIDAAVFEAAMKEFVSERVIKTFAGMIVARLVEVQFGAVKVKGDDRAKPAEYPCVRIVLRPERFASLFADGGDEAQPAAEPTLSDLLRTVLRPQPTKDV